MKTLRIVWALILALVCAEAAAQYVPAWEAGDLARKGTRISVRDTTLDRETTRLLLQEYGGEELVRTWDHYVKQRGWGIGLTAGGYSVAVIGAGYSLIYIVAGVVGSAFAAIGGEEAVQNLWDQLGPNFTGGMIVAGVGLVAGTTGAVLLGRSNHQLKGIVRECNEAGPTSVQVTLGPTPSGFGLSIRF